MLNYSTGNCFRALADPVRMSILERLSTGPATLSEISQPFDMTLAAIVQHVQVLEQSGLVKSEKIGRSRTCRVDPRGLDTISDWVTKRRSMVERQLDRLGQLLASDALDIPAPLNRKNSKNQTSKKRKPHGKREAR